MRLSSQMILGCDHHNTPPIYRCICRCVYRSKGLGLLSRLRYPFPVPHRKWYLKGLFCDQGPPNPSNILKDGPLPDTTILKTSSPDQLSDTWAFGDESYLNDSMWGCISQTQDRQLLCCYCRDHKVTRHLSLGLHLSGALPQLHQ